MINRIREWWFWKRPRIITKEQEVAKLLNYNRKITAEIDRINWATIRPVISSLRELRVNTWDKERIDKAIEWLIDNFRLEEK